MLLKLRNYLKKRKEEYNQKYSRAYLKILFRGITKFTSHSVIQQSPLRRLEWSEFARRAHTHEDYSHFTAQGSSSSILIVDGAIG